MTRINKIKWLMVPLQFACCWARPAVAQNRTVVLTFDDGCISHYTYVAPLLKKYHFGATFYVCEFPGWPDSRKYMSWAQIKTLYQMGFEIGNHTAHHQNVDQQNAAQIRDEIGYIERKCDSVGIPKPRTFAYPAYHTSPVALKVLKEMGYKTARTDGDRPYDPKTDNPLLLPSYTIKGSDSAYFYHALSMCGPGKAVVFTIHGVPDTAHPWVSTPPAIFEKYVQYLYDHHYRVIAMRDLHTPNL
jgi:peptidoglycan/xylan/chitin deacetylase (PgdA/CDA1 family)